ncbi:hypothetical protein MAIC_47690 [Mycolicibacterium aichiense]|uniref:Uncharacterized protein n=1 Tax=Mycolicibacterium aichiense TaxID=1799 RepID=A0AAD1HW81_9MYCO|nr:hypothetical protein MAIC_47690 [Mycolicibacterium aichiense]
MRSPAVQFGSSAAAVAALPISIAPEIMPALIKLRTNIRLLLTMTDGQGRLSRVGQAVEAGAWAADLAED